MTGRTCSIAGACIAGACIAGARADTWCIYFGSKNAENEAQSQDQSGSQVALTKALTMALVDMLLKLSASALSVSFVHEFYERRFNCNISTLYELQFVAMGW